SCTTASATRWAPPSGSTDTGGGNDAARRQGRPDHRRRLGDGRQHGAHLRARRRQDRRRRRARSRGTGGGADLTQKNGPAMFCRLDVTSETDWQQAIDATLAAYGKLDILVNNAGISGSAVADFYDSAAWDR